MSSRRKTGDAAVQPTCSPGCPTSWSVSIHRGAAQRPSPRPAAGGRGTCSGSRRGSAAPLTWALHRWRRSAAGRRRRGRGGAPGLRAALGRPREAERPRLGRSCAPRAPTTAQRRRPQSQPARSKRRNFFGEDLLSCAFAATYLRGPEARQVNRQTRGHPGQPSGQIWFRISFFSGSPSAATPVPLCCARMRGGMWTCRESRARLRQRELSGGDRARASLAGSPPRARPGERLVDSRSLI